MELQPPVSTRVSQFRVSALCRVKKHRGEHCAAGNILHAYLDTHVGCPGLGDSSLLAQLPWRELRPWSTWRRS